MDGNLRRHLSAETLEKFLRNELIPRDTAAEQKNRSNLKEELTNLRKKLSGNGAANEN